MRKKKRRKPVAKGRKMTQVSTKHHAVLTAIARYDRRSVTGEVEWLIEDRARELEIDADDIDESDT